MSEELKENEQKNECKSFCKSEEFKKFLTVALGTFVGVYFALSLFTATHRPPMPPCGFGPQGYMKGCPVKMIHHQHFDKYRHHRDFQRQDKNFQGPAPFEESRQSVEK